MLETRYRSCAASYNTLSGVESPSVNRTTGLGAAGAGAGAALAMAGADTTGAGFGVGAGAADTAAGGEAGAAAGVPPHATTKTTGHVLRRRIPFFMATPIERHDRRRQSAEGNIPPRPEPYARRQLNGAGPKAQEIRENDSIGARGKPLRVDKT